MKKLSAIYFFGWALVIFGIVSCASTPQKRDISKDDPKKVAEIAKLLKASPLGTFAHRGGLPDGEKTGWVTYKIYNKETDTVGVRQIQFMPHPSDSRKRVLEIRFLDPQNEQVTKMVLGYRQIVPNTSGKEKKFYRPAERVIFWHGTKEPAEELPHDMLDASNNMAQSALGLSTSGVEVAEHPKETIKVVAGTFKECLVVKESSIPILRERSDTFYSAAIPTPFIVKIDADSYSQELVRFGFGPQKPLFPANVKTVLMGGSKRKSAE